MQTFREDAGRVRDQGFTATALNELAAQFSVLRASDRQVVSAWLQEANPKLHEALIVAKQANVSVSDTFARLQAIDAGVSIISASSVHKGAELDYDWIVRHDKNTGHVTVVLDSEVAFASDLEGKQDLKHLENCLRSSQVPAQEIAEILGHVRRLL